MLTRKLILREEGSSDLEPLLLYAEDGLSRVLSKVMGRCDVGRGLTEMVGRRGWDMG